MKADSVVSEHHEKKLRKFRPIPVLLFLWSACLRVGIDFRSWSALTRCASLVSLSEWDFNIDELKRHGKDPESVKRKEGALKGALTPYVELTRGWT
jgi:hypothetical protein